MTDIEALWHEYHDRVFNYVRFKTRSAESEDLAQTVFLRALRAIQNGNGPSDHESGWIWRITNNVVIDYYRFCGHLPDFVEMDANHRFEQDGANWESMEAELLTSPEPGPDELAIQHIEQQRLWRAIECLPSAKQIRAMKLHLEGYGNDEISEVMQTTDKVTRQLHVRARKYLRERLKEAA